MSVTFVNPEFLTNLSSSTTSSQSPDSLADPKFWENSQVVYSSQLEDGKCSASPATPLNPPERVGGVKADAEKPRMDLISPIAVVELARVLTHGATKYEANNWRRGLAWTRIISAILRHTFAYLGGQTHDPETGLSHMAHVMCNAMFLVEFERTRPEFDDRMVP